MSEHRPDIEPNAPVCRRTLTGRASAAAHEAALAAGQVYEHAVVTQRIRLCYSTWRSSRALPIWIGRNDFIDLLDGWYSAAAQPFERGNFTVTTDVRTISSRIAELAWVSREANQHAGRIFGRQTMRFAGPDDTSANRRTGARAKLWEDVVDGDHPLSCDFLDLYVNFILPVSQANGQIRDWVQDLLAVPALTKSARTAYRDRFKGSGGGVINAQIFAQLQSPEQFEQLLLDPLDCLDKDDVVYSFVESVLRLVAVLRENWEPAAQRAADFIEARLTELGLNALAPDPKRILSPVVLAAIRAKWTRTGPISLAELSQDPAARSIAERRLRQAGMKADPPDVSAALEMAAHILQCELADLIAGTDAVPAQTEISRQDLTRLVGAWVDQDRDLPLQRLPVSAHGLIREEKIVAFAGVTVPLAPADPTAHDAADDPADDLADDPAGDLEEPPTLDGILREELAGREDDLTAGPTRVALAVAEQVGKVKGTYDTLVAKALSAERARLQVRRRTALATHDDELLSQIDASEAALTERAVKKVLQRAATVCVEKDAEMQALDHARRQGSPTADSRGEMDGPSDMDGQASER